MKIGDAGIVEGDVAVFPDPHHHHVGRVFFQERGVARAGGFRIPGPSVDIVDLVKGNEVEEPLPKEIPEALRSRGGKPHVFVHMKGAHSFPRDGLVRGERSEHLVLGGSGGKDHMAEFFPGKHLPDGVGRVARGGRSHFGSGIVDPDGQGVDGKASHGRTSLSSCGQQRMGRGLSA